MIWPFKKRENGFASEPAIYADLQDNFGRLSEHTRASVPHFLVGGHVDLRPFADERGWVTVDMRTWDDYPPSLEGYRYELFTTIDNPHPEISTLLTVLARHFSEHVFADGDTVLVFGIEGFRSDHPKVRLDLFGVGQDGIAAYRVVYDEASQ